MFAIIDLPACSELLLSNEANQQTPKDTSRHLKFESAEDLPRTFKQRWLNARQVQFPITKVDAWLKLGIPARDAIILRQLSKSELLSKLSTAPGWAYDRKIFIEAISSDENGLSALRNVLINIGGRRYLVQTEQPVWAESSEGGSYRVSAKPKNLGKTIRVSHIVWEDIIYYGTKSWLINDNDSVGTLVETKSGHFFTRVTSKGPFEKAAWRDEESGKVWAVAEKPETSEHDAERICAEAGAALPTREMFEELAKKKAAPLLLRGIDHRTFWTSARNSITPFVRLVFDNKSQGIEEVSIYGERGIICVK